MILYLVIDIVFYKKTLIQKQITFAIVSMQLFLYMVQQMRLELTPHFWDQLLRLACLPFHHFRIVRRGRDSNPGTPYEVFSFQDWRNLPLCHLSIKKMLSIQAAITLVTLSQHNHVINLLWYLSDLSKNFYANSQINIVKSKFFF